ncbi:MAG TPA: bacillithiol system redox-active protein YtxJ [Taishania sp.]|nr:bacillithiol system redox-active protein YtxJ [Taishania sp.]
MGFFSYSKNTEINWTDLVSEEQLLNAINQHEKIVFIFKHSTRCSISSMAKSRFERGWVEPTYAYELLYLDLLTYRPVSNKIEEVTGIIHQSPQLIVIQNGEVVYHESHGGISADAALKSVK